MNENPERNQNLLNILRNNLEGDWKEANYDNLSLYSSATQINPTGNEFENFMHFVFSNLGLEKYQHSVYFKIPRIIIKPVNDFPNQFSYESLTNQKTRTVTINQKEIKITGFKGNDGSLRKIEIDSEAFFFHKQNNRSFSYELDNCYCNFDENKRCLYITEEKQFSEGFFKLNEKNNGKFTFNFASKNFVYENGNNLKIANDTDEYEFEFFSEEQSNSVSANMIKTDLIEDSNDLNKKPLNRNENNFKDPKSKTNQNNALNDRNNSAQTLLPLKEKTSEIRSFTNSRKNQSSKNSDGSSKIKQNYKLKIINKKNNIFETLDLIIGSGGNKHEEIYHDKKISIDLNTKFETDFMFQVPNYFPFDSSIFNEYLKENDKDKKSCFIFPKKSLFVGEVKSFYDFPRAFMQLNKRLLFLRVILNEKNPIFGFLIFKSDSNNFTEKHISKIDNLEKQYDCKIFILFIKNEFIYVSFEDLIKENFVGCLNKLLKDLINISVKNSCLLYLIRCFMKKLDFSLTFGRNNSDLKSLDNMLEEMIQISERKNPNNTKFSDLREKFGEKFSNYLNPNSNMNSYNKKINNSKDFSRNKEDNMSEKDNITRRSPRRKNRIDNKDRADSDKPRKREKKKSRDDFLKRKREKSKK